MRRPTPPFMSSPPSTALDDVCIVGAGPAGLLLGRRELAAESLR